MKLVIYGILAVLVALGTLRLISRKLLYFPEPLSPDRRAALKNFGPALRPLDIPAPDGTRLKGWLLEKARISDKDGARDTDGTDLPYIFYFGGNAEEVSLNLEEFSARVPANMVLVNYRGYGESGGKPTETALKADSLAIFDAVAGTYNLDPSQCLAWGRSLGSSMAAWLARERGLGGLILTCPFDSIEAVAAGFYPAWLVRLVLPDTHRTTDFSPVISCPVLILAAASDEVIPFERTKALYDSLTCPRQLKVIQDAGHNTISAVPGYYEAVQGFVRKTVTGENEN